MAAGRFRGPLDDADRLQRSVQSVRVALAHLQEGNLRQAQYDLFKAVQLAPENTLAHGYLSLVFHHLGRRDEALSELQVALQQAPEDEMLRQVAQLLSQDAAPVQQAAPAPSAPPAPVAPTATPAAPPAARPVPAGRASQPHVEGRLDDALADLEAAVAANPSDSRLHRELSIMYLRAGRLAEAKAQERLAESLRARRPMRPA